MYRPLSLALLFLPTGALAFECATGPVGVNVEASRPVPVNLRLLVEHQLPFEGEAAVELLDPMGAKVPLKELSRDARTVALAPEAPLRPNTVYRFHDLLEGPLDLRFRTTAEPDLGKPAPPRVQTVQRERTSNDLGTIDRLTIVVDPASDAFHWEAQVASDLSFIDALVVRSTVPTLSVGTDRCGTPVAGYDHAATYSIRVRAVDAAGNESPWVVLPPSKPEVRRSW